MSARYDSPAAQRLPRDGMVRMFMLAGELAAAGRDIVHLEIGEPDFDTPAYVTEAGKAALDAGATHYAPVAGLPALREAIAADASAFRGLDVPYAGANVIVGPGAKPVVWNLMAAVLGPGDELICADPGYPVFAAATAFAGATLIPVRLHEATGWRFDLDELRAKITPRTRAIVLNSPQNPTGGMQLHEDIAAVADLALRHDLLVITDEIYSRIVYDGAFASIAQVPEMRERTVIVDGFSKSYAMTGWRLGYCIAPLPIAATLTLLANQTYQCVATFVQRAGIAALAGDQSFIAERQAIFRERRDVVVAGLNALPGVRCATPPGAFYAFPNVTGVTPDDAVLAEFLLREAGVATIPGSAFGANGRGHLRVSYAASLPQLQHALTAIEAALGTFAAAGRT